MSAFSITAATAEGKRVALPNLTRLELTRGLDSPAGNISAVFAVESHPPDLVEITVNHGGYPVFTGNVDEQAFGLSGAGITLTVEGRDRGRRLLDNEALPRTYWNANLATIFTRHIQPYGFTLVNAYPSRTLAVYPVSKGMSEWEAFDGFVRRMHGTRPYVAGNRVFVGRPAPLQTLRFSNTKPGGILYSSLRHVRSPYEMLSKVYLRDNEGYYSSSVTNPAAEFHGAERVRYVIPATEYNDNPGLDANLRIRRAQYKSTWVSLRCPDIIYADPGDEALVEDAAFSQLNLMVESVRYLLGKEGIVTEFVLRNWLYY